MMTGSCKVCLTGTTGLGWFISMPVVDRWHATVDQSALVNPSVAGNVWFSCCSGVWVAFTTSFTAPELLWTIVCGIVGLFFRVLVGRQAWLAMGLATACAISLMELMSLAYPPGLATTILLTTLVPETTFQLSSIGYNAPHNGVCGPYLSTHYLSDLQRDAKFTCLQLWDMW
ncbi:hypothetical protein WJX77_000986 [Trebouxia sp. C0004]